jgi:hypothetical protein
MNAKSKASREEEVDGADGQIVGASDDGKSANHLYQRACKAIPSPRESPSNPSTLLRSGYKLTRHPQWVTARYP